jgi:beta-lactamase class D
MPNPEIQFQQQFQSVFDRRGRAGCCLIQAADDAVIVGCGIDRAAVRKRPMSTFKVLNALIALETGVIDTTEQIDWDGGPAWSDTLKTRMNLSAALAGSAVWFFQILARRIGKDRYRHYLTQCRYGNAECDGAVDSFWLNGTLLISPLEQLSFISRFAQGELPFSDSVVSAVQDMLVVGRGEAGVLRGKTGYADSNREHFGWFVGYLNFAGRCVRGVTLLEMSDACQLGERQEITEECLRLHVIENESIETRNNT